MRSNQNSAVRISRYIALVHNQLIGASVSPIETIVPTKPANCRAVTEDL